MTDYVVDSMAGANWFDINERVGELGAAWTYHPLFFPRWYIYGNRVHCGEAGPVFASGVPTSPDYTVQATLRPLTTVTSPVNLNLGIAGRMSTSQDTYYMFYYQAGESVLAKRVAGVTTTLGTPWISVLSTNTDYTFALEMIGTSIKGFVNGIERVSAVDSDITATGRAGLRSNGINDAGTGNHIDNFRVFDATVPPAPRQYTVGPIGL